MHRPRHFAEERHDVVLDLVRSAGFGHLVAAGADGLTSTPLPFLVDDELTTVRAHLAKPNDVWRCAPCDALLVVPVSDAYVTPSWYPRKREHGEVVPTWNYEVVHLHGRLVAHDDPTWVLALVRELTDLHEGARSEPWSVDDAPTEYVERLAGAIVGVELEIERVEAKRKLSQHRGDEEIAAVVDGLRADATPRGEAIAAAMESLRAD